MQSQALKVVLLLAFLSTMLLLSGCSSARGDETKEAPPAPKITLAGDASLFTVDHPEQFPLVAATAQTATSELVVTGTVAPDVSRAVPVVSLVSGRITGIYARLGDTVRKGQRLLTIRSDDIAGGFSDYRKAVRTEELTRVQLERAKDLYEHGAIALNDFQVAQQAEDNAKVDVETTAEKLELRGSDLQHPTGLVDIVAPASGVITDQQATNAAGVQSLGTAPFTVSDLSTVWVVCDVYENDLANVHLGDVAEISLNASPIGFSKEASATSPLSSIRTYALPRFELKLRIPE
jgi:cobalt-zinc-cadmium efflux system membrane fusion protein